MDETIRLVAFRLPAGWTTRRNVFYEVDPLFDQHRLINRDFFEDSMLILERVPYRGHPLLRIEVGWCDRSDGGAYRALLRDSSHRILKRFVARDREEVRLHVEHWLDTLSQVPRVEMAVRMM